MRCHLRNSTVGAQIVIKSEMMQAVTFALLQVLLGGNCALAQSGSIHGWWFQPLSSFELRVFDLEQTAQPPLANAPAPHL